MVAILATHRGIIYSIFHDSTNTILQTGETLYDKSLAHLDGSQEGTEIYHYGYPDSQLDFPYIKASPFKVLSEVIYHP